MKLRSIYFLSALYLSISSLFFVIFWIRWPLSLMFILFYLIAFTLFWKSIKKDASLDLAVKPYVLLLLLLISFFCLVITGCGGFTFQVFDYAIHNSKIRDVAVLDLPIKYTQPNIYATYYFGYYLPPGLLLKLFPTLNYSLITLLWSLIGFQLGLTWIWFLLKSLKRTIFFLLMGGLFSTLYSLYINFENFIRSGNIPFTELMLQYLPLLSNLGQVPNQIIPTMLVTAILIYEVRSNRNWLALIFMIASLFFWSPFSFLSLLVFYLAVFLFYTDWTQFNWLKWSLTLLVNLLAFLPILVYLTSVNSSIEKGFFVKYESNYLTKWLLFVSLEVFVLLYFVLRGKAVPIVLKYIALLHLILIPIYRFGMGNDFVMRASMVSQLVFYVSFVSFESKKKFPKILWYLVFMLATTMPIKIIGRGILTFQTDGYQKMKYEQYIDCYDNLLHSYNKKTADQYLMSPDSIFEKYFLKK